MIPSSKTLSSSTHPTEDQLVGSSSPLIGPEPLITSTSVTTASIIRSGHLPRPQLGIIAEIERAIKALARTLAVKEKICEYIQQEVRVNVRLLLRVVSYARIRYPRLPVLVLFILSRLNINSLLLSGLHQTLD